MKVGKEEEGDPELCPRSPTNPFGSPRGWGWVGSLVQQLQNNVRRVACSTRFGLVHGGV